MGDRIWAAISPRYVTIHEGQLGVLPHTGRYMCTDRRQTNDNTRQTTTTTDDDRRQRAKQYYPSPTLCVGEPVIIKIYNGFRHVNGGKVSSTIKAFCRRTVTKRETMLS